MNLIHSYQKNLPGLENLFLIIREEPSRQGASSTSAGITAFEKFLKDVEQHEIPIVIGILPLANFRNTEFLYNEVPGSSIPQAIRNRLKKATDRDDAKKIGIEIAQDMLMQINDAVQGVYLMLPFGRMRRR